MGATVTLISDSQYTLKGISEWRAGWEKNGFKNSKNQPVANLHLWKELYSIVDDRKVTTKWVKGHGTDKHNIKCDKLASTAVENRPRDPFSTVKSRQGG